MKRHLPAAASFFSILFLLLSFNPATAQQWQVLGNEQQIASATSSFTSIATTDDGAVTILYVVYTESNIAKVKRFDGENWEPVGGNVSAGNACSCKCRCF